MLRTQHAEATRRAVLAAARALFGRKGYAQTSVDDIAAAARVTKGAVYHHFAGKKALFRAVYAEVEAETQTRAVGAGDPEDPPIDQIVAKVNAYLDAALDEEIRQITLIDGPTMFGLEPENAPDQQAAQAGVRLFIATAIARGQIADLDPDVLTEIIGGLAWLGGLLIARASDPDASRAALGKALDTMLRGLAPYSGRNVPTHVPGLRILRGPAPSIAGNRGCLARIPRVCSIPMESKRLETRLGPLAWRASGRGPALVFFAGALANGDLWRDVVAALEDRYTCITVDLPLGAHPWPLSPGADRSAVSLARLELDCLELLDVEDATVVANDTAGGLLLLSLASGHPALGRVSRLVLTNCENYDLFPPPKLKMAASASRAVPWLAQALLRLQTRSAACCAGASPRSPRADWTTSAWSRSSGRCNAIAEWPPTWSRPSPGNARRSSSTPPGRSRASTGRSW